MMHRRCRCCCVRSAAAAVLDVAQQLEVLVAYAALCAALAPDRVDLIASCVDMAYRVLAATTQRASSLESFTAASSTGTKASGRSPPSLAKLSPSDDFSPPRMAAAGMLEGGGGWRTPLGSDQQTSSAGATKTNGSKGGAADEACLPLLSADGQEALTELLAAALEMSSLRILTLETYAPLLDFLDAPTRTAGKACSRIEAKPSWQKRTLTRTQPSLPPGIPGPRVAR